MGHGAARAGGHDGIEGRPLGAEEAHPVLDFGGQRGFGHAGAQVRHGAREDLRIEPDGAADQFHFGGRFHHLERFNQPRRGLERSTQRQAGLGFLVDLVSDLAFLEADAPQAVARRSLHRGRLERAADHSDPAIHLAGGLDRIARVGEAAIPQKRQASRAGEAGQVTDVGRGGGDQGVDLPGFEGGGSAPAACGEFGERHGVNPE